MVWRWSIAMAALLTLAEGVAEAGMHPTRLYVTARDAGSPP